MNGWHGLNDDRRAELAIAVLNGGSEANAPEPLPEFAPPAEPVETAPQP
jgi:hypothetical protein